MFETHTTADNYISVTVSGSGLNNTNDPSITPTFEFTVIQYHSPPIVGSYALRLADTYAFPSHIKRPVSDSDVAQYKQIPVGTEPLQMR